MRTYTFYDNGRVAIVERVCLLRQCRKIARELFGERTRYIDVLDEGVLVERVQ